MNKELVTAYYVTTVLVLYC